MNPAALSAAFAAVRDFAIVPDVTTGSKLDLANKNFSMSKLSGASSKTVKLPDDGFIHFVHQSGGANAITVQDSDGSVVATVGVNETALCIRVGNTTNRRWHAVIMGMNAVIPE